MANKIRNVTKNLIGAEDLLFGRGKTTQMRGSTEMTLHGLDLALPVEDELELATTDTTRYPKASIGTRMFVAVNGDYQELSHILPVIYEVGGALSSDYPYCIDGETIAKWNGALPKTLTVEDKGFGTAGWEIYSVGGGRVIVSETEPPQSYQKLGISWYIPSEGSTYVWDETNGVGSWVEQPVTSMGAGATVTSETAPAAYFNRPGYRWYVPSTGTSYVWDVTNGNGSWVEEPVQSFDGQLRKDLGQSLSSVQIGDITAGQIAMALKNTVTPEQFGTGANNIQLAINYCSSVGGGTVLLGSKTYTVTQPIELKRKVNLIGVNPEATFIRKEAASTIDGIDAIIIGRDAELVNQFRVENICLIGNRTSKAAGNTVTTQGIFLNFAHFYIVRNVRIEQCARAYVANQNYVAVIERVTGLMCQSYAFDFYNGCTTISASNLLSWGCGGGYKIDATIYSTFRDCACDHSDAGGRPDDPFLPQGSGGDYLNPSYIWEITASRITITGAGCENSYSKWLYGEGAFVDFINPYVFNMEGHGTPYRAIEVRGTGKSRVNITNAKFDIRLGLPASESRRMYYVESPRNQTIYMDTPVSGDAATFGDFAHPVRGVVFSETIPLMNFTQESMIVGQTLYPLMYTLANVEPTTTLVGNTKRFNVLNKTATYQVIRLPIDYEGTLEVIAQGSHSSSYDVFQLRVVGWDGTNTDVVKTIELTGAFDKREYVYLGEGATAATTKPLYLELRSSHSSDVTYFTNLKVSRIK